VRQLQKGADSDSEWEWVWVYGFAFSDKNGCLGVTGPKELLTGISTTILFVDASPAFSCVGAIDGGNFYFYFSICKGQ